jgi:GNAT superfamily N-acetyltransferase
MRLQIRRGGATDAPAAARLYLRAREAAAAAGTIPPGIHDEADVTGYLAARELWLAGDAGLLVLEDDWLAQLYVEPGRTGRGIGTHLLAVAKRERPAGLRLWTFQSNLGARRFYERHGFAEVLRTDGATNEERSPDVLYAWAPRLVTILADDLTGAADCGLAFLRAGFPVTVGLGAAPGPVAAIDLDTRRHPDAAAVRAAAAGAEGLLYKKIDSTLRGDVAAEVRAAMEGAGLPRAVIAPAFPAQGRTVRGGRVYVDGRPGRALDGILDAETDEDLRAIVAAVGDEPVLWAGSAGLAAHVAATLPAPGYAPEPVRADGPVLIAVGSPEAAHQVAAIDDSDGIVLTGRDLGPAVAARRGEIGGLVVTGGATARDVMEALEERTIALAGEVEPGVPVGRLGSGLPIVTKAGGFGGPATLEVCRRYLQGA